MGILQELGVSGLPGGGSMAGAASGCRPCPASTLVSCALNDLCKPLPALQPWQEART